AVAAQSRQHLEQAALAAAQGGELVEEENPHGWPPPALSTRRRGLSGCAEASRAESGNRAPATICAPGTGPAACAAGSSAGCGPVSATAPSGRAYKAAPPWPPRRSAPTTPARSRAAAPPA